MHLYMHNNISLNVNIATCFDHHSDHRRGVRRFLVKVTEFNIRCGEVCWTGIYLLCYKLLASLPLLVGILFVYNS
jgi:hypothetical protein